LAPTVDVPSPRNARRGERGLTVRFPVVDERVSRESDPPEWSRQDAAPCRVILGPDPCVEEDPGFSQYVRRVVSRAKRHVVIMMEFSPI